MREETVVGNAYGGMEGTWQPWKQGDTAESHVGGGAITIASLSPHASIGGLTIERLAHQASDTQNYRVGPHAECPFK